MILVEVSAQPGGQEGWMREGLSVETGNAAAGRNRLPHLHEVSR